MKIHEYQGKAILARFGVPVPRGEVVCKKEEARAAAAKLGTKVVVVKAQIHAGGRGKGGGVKLARSVEEAAELAGKILGMTLVTHQTGPEGRLVRRLLIEEGLDIKKEIYLGLLVDRTAGAPVFMASAAGGMSTAGSTQEESPEWIPASSMCCMMPAITTSSPSASASTSTSVASSRKWSIRMGRSCEYSTASFM